MPGSLSEQVDHLPKVTGYFRMQGTPLQQLLQDTRDQGGTSIAEYSRRAPLLLVFLRHFG